MHYSYFCVKLQVYLGTIRIDKKSLEDLELDLVLEQVSDLCITNPGKEKVLAITPFSSSQENIPELRRLKEFKASLDGDNPIPNHGFDPVFKELHLLDIENSSLESSSFRRILTIVETTRILRKFFKKFEEFYIDLNQFSEDVNHSPSISEEIHKMI